MAKHPDTAPRAIAAIAERMVRNMEKHPVALSLQGEVNRLRAGAEALDNLRMNRSPLDTPAAHTVKVAKAAKRLDSEITAMINRLGQITNAGLQDAQRRIDEKVNLKPDAFAQEIRAAFRALDAKGKASLIKELVDGNRGPEMAAIVRAPAMLTGITEEQRATYERMIVARHAGDELDEIGAINEISDAGLTAINTAARMAKRMTDPTELAAIERAAAEADAAGDSFNQSLQ